MNGWQTAATVLCVISGTVYDAQHHPVRAAKVHLESTDKKELVAETDSTGTYRFSVPTGNYMVHVEGESAMLLSVKKDTNVDLTVPPAFFDEPKFSAAGLTDYTYRGGHGSDTVFRSTETLAKETEALKGAGDPKENEVFEHGTELLNHRQAQAAVEVFAKGARSFPDSARMLLGLASAYYSAGSYDEAAPWFYKATDLSPNDPAPYLFLGKVKARQITESSGYKERMTRFARLQPENALAHYYYGATLPDDEAQVVLERAVKLDPRLAAAHVRLGIIAMHHEKYAEAIRDYKRAIEGNPKLEEAHYRLSEAYRLTGEQAKAKEELGVFERLSKGPLPDGHGSARSQ
jgi:tetratricopeptide (TPR) repeat protein